MRPSWVMTPLAAALALASPAWAALGGDAASVAADQDSIKGTLVATPAARYTRYEIRTASGTLLAEYAPSNRRGFVSSFVDVFGFAAFVVGAGLVLVFTSTLGADALNSWGWRVLFMLALPLGVAGLYLRRRLEDTPEFRAVQEKGE